MTHLAVKRTPDNPHGTACRDFGEGDRIATKYVLGTCSACDMNVALYREYIRTLQPPGWRQEHGKEAD